MMDQAEKAHLFGTLHVKGDPLALYNIWGDNALDAMGSRREP
ncbi:MAG: hypothetical protein ACR2Q4_24715 [Geminicoccaceae bacterium]